MSVVRLDELTEAQRGLVLALIAAMREDRPPATPAPDKLLSIPEAAEALGVGRSTVYQELSAGRLRSIKVGRRRLIPSSAIAELTQKAPR